MRNAVRYTKKETEVEITIKKQEKTVEISIQDYGEGVPEKELTKLFKPFYRVQEARDRKSGGNGLGLAIAERAVSNHKGSIVANNTENGLIVVIRLPAYEG